MLELDPRVERGLVLKLVAGFGGRAMLELRVLLELRAVIGGGAGFANAV